MIIAFKNLAADTSLPLQPNKLTKNPAEALEQAKVRNEWDAANGLKTEIIFQFPETRRIFPAMWGPTHRNFPSSLVCRVNLRIPRPLQN